MRGHVLAGVPESESEMEMASQERYLLLKSSENAPIYGGKPKRNHRIIFLVMMGLLVCFVIATIVLAAVLGHQIANEEDCLNACTSSTCLEATSYLIQGLDTSVDPCEDFYKYSCGNWEANNVMPEGFGRYGTFNELATSNSITLMKALEEAVAEGDDGAVSKARYMYAQCMDVERLNSRGSEPLRELVARTGGWDLINVDESQPGWSLDSQLFLEHYHASNAFFTTSVQPDDVNSNEVIIKFYQSGLTLPSNTYYSDETYAEATRAYIKAILLLLGADDIDALDTAINGIFELERRLAEAFYSPTELRNVSLNYNPMTIDEFTEMFSTFDWISDYLTGLFGEAGIEREFSGDDVIVIGPLGYFEELDDYLEGVDNDELLKNYAKWSLVKHYINLMGRDFLDAYYTFTSAVTGNGEKQRYLSCVELVQNSLPMAVARPFVDKYFTNDSIREMNDIITAIRNTFKQRLGTKDWLDEETEEKCKEKVDKISEAIAYPEFIKNDDKLNDFYANVSIDSDDELFESYEQVLQFVQKDRLSQYGNPTDKERWSLPPTVVNAYYSPSFNRFVFLAGILRHPFFETGWPSYLSYGGIGVVIGHELTHGFDDQGQQYDANGNRKEWWTEESRREFQERTMCFEKQYSNYSLDGEMVNGSLTLGENIADNGGVHNAFQAYRNFAGNAPTLPGTNLTNDQLFFVAFGQVWCSLYTEEYLQLQVVTNPHSPGPIRVLGSLSNSQEFANAFNCPVGSTMNPEDKCQLW